MKKHTIYLIHGYTASPEANWFPDFRKQLESDTVAVHILKMPNSHQPDFEEWVNHMDNEIIDFDENSIFVGHSLGCVTALNYLSKYSSKKIMGLYMISGFVEGSPIPELLPFVKNVLSYSKLIKQAAIRVAITAKDDDIVPYQYSTILAEKLEADLTILETGKHFIDRDGFTAFPLLIKQIKETIKLEC